MTYTPDPFSLSIAPGLPGSVNLVEELWQSSLYGIPEGQTLHVPAGYSAVIINQGNILYVLSPFSYLLARHTFPMLQPLPGPPGTQPMLQGTIYLICTNNVVLAWEQPMVSKARWSEGAAYENVRGRYGVRIMNPPLFLTSAYRRLNASASASEPMQSFRLSQPNSNAGRGAAMHLAAEANQFAAPILKKALVSMEILLRFRKTSILQDPVAAQGEIGKIIAPLLNADGVHLQFITIDGVSARAGVPCESCGSTTRPTGQVAFSSNISLFVIRFMRSRKGCFCALCATKYFFEHTLITLFAGWWGVIGCLLSPVLIGSNIVNLSKALCRWRVPPAMPVPGNSPRLP